MELEETMKIGILKEATETKQRVAVASKRNGYKRHPSLRVGDSVGLAPVLNWEPGSGSSKLKKF